MGLENMFMFSMNVIWQDLNTFIRVESKCKTSDVFSRITNWLDNNKDSALTVLIVCTYFIWFIPYFVIIIVYAYFKRSRIFQSAYEIEVTPNNYKLIRNKSNMVGVCCWYNWYNCELLLSSKYEEIEHFGKEAFIIGKNNRYGIYNAKQKKLVVQIDYNNYEFVDDFVILSSFKVKVKYNIYGERIMF